MFFDLCILCIFVRLCPSSCVKYSRNSEAVVDDATGELAESVSISRPPLFLETHGSRTGRSVEHSRASAPTTASNSLQQNTLPNKLQQASSAGLAQMQSLLQDLDAMNNRLVDSYDEQIPDKGLDASSSANQMSDSSKDGWQTPVDIAGRNTKMKQQDNSPNLFQSHSVSNLQGSRSQQSFIEHPVIFSSSQQLHKPIGADSERVGPYSSPEPSSVKSSMLEMRSDFDRPQVSSGKPDIVNFGLYGKLFYGTDLKNQEFTIDNIMTLAWSDPRVSGLIPSGQTIMTLATSEAKSKMWLPDIWITNKIAHKSDLISSSLTIASNGTVSLVERTYAVIKNRFALEEYPFDEQTLRLAIASEKYMLSDLILSPLDDPTVSGLREGFFQNAPYRMVDFSINTDDDVDGLLQKSRGYMEVIIERTPSKYQHRYLFPAILYSAISCAVFWLPFTPEFVVPRLALSIIILLVFSNFAIIVDGELPEGAPYNWIDLICMMVRLHMFSVICLNIFTEVALYTMGCKITALLMNNELKLLSPLAIASNLGLIFIGSQTKGSLSLTTLSILLPIFFALFLVTYATCSAYSLTNELKKHRSEYESGFGGDALSSAESLTPVPRYQTS